MTTPICFECKHFRQYQPLTFNTPGECVWAPPVPAWVQSWLDLDCNYYGPDRGVHTKSCVIETCDTFEEI